MVRAHAAWALGRIGGWDALEALEASLSDEEDPDVIEEVRTALAELREVTRSK